MNPNPELLARLVEQVLASKKYATIQPELIRTIGAQELAKRRSLKEAVKATRNKLHQTVGAYREGQAPPYDAWLAQLHQCPPAERSQLCRRLLTHHASTRERLPILDEFYGRLFAGLPPIRTLLDLACGLNPLTAPWMGLPPGARYLAWDVDYAQMAFLQQALALLGVAGDVAVHNLLAPLPPHQADVALLLKTLPCLEQVDKTIGLRLLDGIHAPVIFVSFPAQSIGGRAKGMAANYTAHFLELVASRPWAVTRFDFATEVVFRVVK
ncbi:MAG: 16S rRNA methyltransferase [Litorilinea sp.]|nr:MAG: 16S rRNA methyltransferase [Litorilinea sp.]